MSILKTLSRSVETAIKLPVAATWDFISLGNMGDGSSTMRVVREHQAKKQLDDLVEIVEKINELQK